MNVNGRWTENAYVDTAGTADGAMNLYLDGMTGPCVTLYKGLHMSADEMATVADKILAGVQRWRDRIVENAERARTTEDELAAAKARIAELERQAEDGAA